MILPRRLCFGVEGSVLLGDSHDFLVFGFSRYIYPFLAASYDSVQKYIYIFFHGIKAAFHKWLQLFSIHLNSAGHIFRFYVSCTLFVNVCWLLLMTHLALLPIPVELDHHPITPAVTRLLIYQNARTFLHTESTKEKKLSKVCLTGSNRWSVCTVCFY